MDITYLPNDGSLRSAQATQQAADRQKGQLPSRRTSRAELIRNQQIFQYRPNASTVGQIQISYITHNYAPSSASLSALKKTYINDLRLQTHHRGSYVLLRALGPPSRMGAVMNAVEDENGGCDLVQLYTMDPARDPRKILPEGQVFIIKEPFYKINATGGTSVRVDHVSDVVFLSADDSRVPVKWRPRIALVEKSVSDWKVDGNALFRDGLFHEAIECYTKGLQAAEDIIKTLRLNRAQALLSAGLHDKALEDSNFVLQADPTDEKALFREAKALYLARKFKDCKARLMTHVKAHPGNKEAKSMLLKVFQRLQEEQTGKYDFKEMRKLTSSKQQGPVRFDCADFVGPVQVQDTTGSGRGLFATRDVAFGELLLCSKAFHVCHSKTDGMSHIVDLTTNRTEIGSGSQLVSGIAQKLYKNPSTAKEFLQLYSGGYERVQESEVDGMPIVDTFLIHEIRKLNAFGCPVASSVMEVMSGQQKSGSSGVGIWIMPSFLNHSCQGAGSARRSFIGDMMVVRASRDIKKGEEVTFKYFNESDVEIRRKDLLKTWSFSCNCSLCTFESQESSTIRYSRQRQLAAILSLKPTGQNSTALLQELTQMIKSLEDTYSKPSTEQPRYAVFQALYHIVELRLGDPNEILETFKSSLKALGYRIRESQDKVFVARHGSMITDVPGVLRQCSEAYDFLGKFSLAKSYSKLAADFWEVAFGERASFDESLEPDVWKKR